MITYWLYYGYRCLTSVRGAVGLNDAQVKALIDDLHVYIACDRPDESPAEFRTRLAYAEVKIFERG